MHIFNHPKSIRSAILNKCDVRAKRAKIEFLTRDFSLYISKGIQSVLSAYNIDR